MGIVRNFLNKKGLEKQVASLQHQLDDVLSGLAVTNTVKYKGNDYRTYEKMTEQLSKMYNGCADWGCDLAKNIVDLRAAFTVAGGVTVKPKEGVNAEREIEFVRDFMDLNNLDEEVVFDWAKEAEVEGKFLCRLFPNAEKKNIDARFIPWTAHKYRIETDPQDYARYVKATYKMAESNMQVEIPVDDFVYKKFGGRTHVVNDTPSRTGLIINRIEFLDKCLWDWRKINLLYASPTPVIQAKTNAEAKEMWDHINKKNWKIGKLIVTSGTFSFAEVGLASKESLRDEMMAYIKIISGATGIPPHFLGAPDLMSNRAVSNDLFDLIEASVVKERKIWVGGYKELFSKAILMNNRLFQQDMNPDAVDVEIPQVSEHKLKEIVETWLPLHNANIIDEETILGMVPGINVEQVKKNRAKSTLEYLRQIKEAGMNGNRFPEEGEE